ncbi:poly-gamma-glutamate synthesis protein (capsule biosynthesis protein) [Actinomadura pelletieri DSM 43383]|uniref:Poly-gamma-glutamate synthesis protein (Capsule biosynthesis protein) n=1 Tax=Actinomadura pelletieri DSM 43383 TaxID=1120940 RepID=A0A495QYY6_9ACTN|nr:CapA family protein [Actinomadura pelletieri]RKS79136.1 poly-gamma-glutamate synthesis protein (capsule biosynthesis protein) [Actinomadura pelletieri DSM 43383]
MGGRARRVAAAAMAGTMALTAAACGDNGGSVVEGATKGPTSEGRGNSPEGKPSKAPAKQPIVLAFGGDTHFEGMLRSRLGNPETALGPVAKQLRSADLAMINLETAITTGGGTPAPKAFTFRAPPTAFTALKAAGVDVVSMANNHGMDYMEGGLRESLAAIKRSGFPVVGIGKNADDAFRPYRVTVKGNKLAIVGATQVLDDNLIQAWTATDTKGGLASAKNVPRMVQAVKEARKGADVVIVHLHWGAELQPCPLPRQQELAKQLVAAGADIVVGGHAHIPLGGGYLDNAYVHYGMGNFVFYSANGKTAESGVLFLRVQNGKVVKDKWAPARISGGLPIPLKGAAAQSALQRWNGLRDCTGLQADPP